MESSRAVRAVVGALVGRGHAVEAAAADGRLGPARDRLPPTLGKPRREDPLLWGHRSGNLSPRRPAAAATASNPTRRPTPVVLRAVEICAGRR